MCRGPFTEADINAFISLAAERGLNWETPPVPDFATLEAPQAPIEFVALCCPRMMMVYDNEMVETQDRRMRFQPPRSYVCFRCGRGGSLLFLLRCRLQSW